MRHQRLLLVLYVEVCSSRKLMAAQTRYDEVTLSFIFEHAVNLFPMIGDMLLEVLRELVDLRRWAAPRRVDNQDATDGPGSSTSLVVLLLHLDVVFNWLRFLFGLL